MSLGLAVWDVVRHNAKTAVVTVMVDVEEVVMVAAQVTAKALALALVTVDVKVVLALALEVALAVLELAAGLVQVVRVLALVRVPTLVKEVVTVPVTLNVTRLVLQPNRRKQSLISVRISLWDTSLKQ